MPLNDNEFNNALEGSALEGSDFWVVWDDDMAHGEVAVGSKQNAYSKAMEIALERVGDDVDQDAVEALADSFMLYRKGEKASGRHVHKLNAALASSGPDEAFTILNS